MIPLPHAAPGHGIVRARFEGDPKLSGSLAVGATLLAIFAIGVALILLGLA